MTDERLRDLLEERVADLTTRDLAAGAWQEGARRRRHRRTAGAAVTAAVAALVVGVSLVVGGSPAADPPPSDRPAPTEPDATVGGARVWWSPDVAEEAALPAVDSPLPDQVDLDAVGPDAATDPLTRAVAAYGVVDGAGDVARLLLVGPEGEERTLDVSRLDPVAKPNGYRLSPITRTMLSPDGRTLAFGQDGAVAFFDVALGTWREVPVGDRATHALRWAGPRLLAFPHGDGLSVDGTPVDVDLPVLGVLGPIDPATPHGPWVHSADGISDAQAFGYGARLPSRGAEYTGHPETVVVQDAAAPDVLAISSTVDDGRYKDCCPVVGFLDGDTVLYESRSAEPRVLAWDVGTRTFGVAATIVGVAAGDESYVGSYAQLDVVAGDAASSPADPADPAGPAGSAGGAPDTTSRGTAVWWGPEAAEEGSLPPVDGGPLPTTIDLGVTSPFAPQPWVRAVLSTGAGVVVLEADGTTSRLDTSRLTPFRDEGGNVGDPLTAGAGLDPAGTHVAFAQRDSLEVYTFATGSWSTVPTGAGAAEGARWWRPGVLLLPSGETYAVDGTPLGRRDADPRSVAAAGDAPYGPLVVVEGALAQSLRMTGPVDGGDLANPEAVVVRRGGERLALALPQDGRAKGCCPVVGLPDAGTVVFRSDDALLAWTVGTPDVRRVSTVTGAEGWVGSFADLS